MNTLQLTYKENYAIVQLDRGTSNPINLEMLFDLQKAFTDLKENDNVKGVMLTGKPNFFSAGLDVIELYNYDKATIEKLFVELFNTLKTLLSFNKPLVSAITGHSPAGGCVLAICSDYRVMASGKFRIGLNEIPVGIIMPNFIYQIYAYWLGGGKASQYILEGKLLLAEEALQVGLVDEVVDAQKVEEHAIAQLQKYMQFGANTWQQSKANMRKDILAHYTTLDKKALDILLEQWWSKDTRMVLGSLVAKLTGK